VAREQGGVAPVVSRVIIYAFQEGDFKGIVQRKLTGVKLGSNDRHCFSVVVLDIIFYF
jgi:hypothetical protein